MVLGENQINHLSKLELYILQDRKRRLVVRESSQTRPLLLVLAIVSYIRLPIEIPRDIAFIPSILKCVQRWRVSWIRSIVQFKKKNSKMVRLQTEIGNNNNNNNIFISYIKYTNITPPANSKANRGRWCVDGLRFITKSWSEKVHIYNKKGQSREKLR